MRLAEGTSVKISALVLASLLWGQAALAQSDAELQGVERALEEDASKANELQRQAEALDNEIAKLKMALVEGAKSVQDAEQQVSEVEAALSDLEHQERTRADDLAARRAELGRILVALERLSVRPISAAFFSDRSPAQEARIVRLLAIAGTNLNERAGVLVGELAELSRLRSDIAIRRSQLTEAIGKLSKENQNLTALLKKKAKLQASTLKETEATRKRMEKLSEQARSLKELLDRLEATKQEQPEEQPSQPIGAAPSEAALGPLVPEADQDRPAPAGIRELPEAGAPLVRPVRGKVAAGFGQSTEALGQSTGLVFAARSKAEVVAPFDGKVVFEGPFRSYGQILIIEHSGGYHSVLAGLSRAEVSVGQWLLAGEPVGSMAEEAQGSRLYFEFRHNGQPLDPAPWLGDAVPPGEQDN